MQGRETEAARTEPVSLTRTDKMLVVKIEVEWKEQYANKIKPSLDDYFDGVAGVALNPATGPQAIEWVLDDLDLILVMSVNPGFGGQSFIPSSIAKVRQIKSLVGTRPIEISVDGGVKSDTAGPLAKAGATMLVAGSAIFGAQDPGQAVKDLRGASEVLK